MRPLTPRLVDAMERVNLTLPQRIAIFIVLTILLALLTLIISPVLTDISALGYIGGFVIAGLTAATVVIPAPGFAAVLIMARDLNPFLLGVLAGLGGTFGELTAYWLGAQGREPLEGHRYYEWMRRAMERRGGIILFLIALIPALPVDAGGIIAGASRYPVLKFLLYLGAGKLIMTIAVLYLAHKAFEWAEPYLRWLG